MALRDWGRAWDVLYWSGVVVALAAGLTLPPKVGVMLLGLALFLLVLAPFRDHPSTFWPVLTGYLAFAIGFTLVGLTVARPVVPGLLIGLAAAGAGVVVARTVTRKQRELAEEQERG
ncbi:MAG: hypothetical protein KY437_06500 [Actinobacteria bacterium]|nr:hypothetical protein [Actinomycetota bacterium]